MKKVLLFVTALLLSVGMYAQNRFLIHHDNTTSGYIINNVDSLTFANVEGEVAADLEILSFDMSKVTLKVTRTAACEGFKIAVEPTVKFAAMSDFAIAQYIDNDAEYVYYQDFSEAELSGIELLPNTEYTIATVGIDEYGILCDVRKAEFTTPNEVIIGNPEVTAELVEANHYDFTVKFTPNEDVSKYSVVVGEKGQLQSQYEMFAPMMGFSNMGQMIESWGLQYTEETTHTWTSMAPSTEYEVFIQAWDLDGTMVPYTIFELTTKSLGGEGTAKVEITIGEYKLAEWWDEEGKPVMLPSQFITFSPNDQASAYRFGVYLASNYDTETELIKEDLCSEPPMPSMGWFFYEELTTDYQINPNTECVAIAAAKNANGEWGPITEVRFTTSSDVTSKSASNTITAREFKAESEAGKIPVIKQKQPKLIGK